MEKSKFLTIVIIVMLVVNLVTLAILFIDRGKDKRHGPPPHGKGDPASFIISELGFDDSQINLFNELKKEHQGQMKSMQDSLKTQRELLPDLIIEGNEAKADSVSTLIGKYQKNIELYTYQHFVKVYVLCKDDQKKKFKNVLQEVLKMMAPPKGGPPK